MIPGSEDITDLITPFVSAMIALVISLWIRDTAGRVAKGMAFKFNRIKKTLRVAE